MFFQSNIRFLRERKELSQELTAGGLGVKRSTLNNYENGYAQPKLEMLPFFSKFYKVSIDSLINIDLSRLSDTQLREMEEGHDTYIKGTKLRVLATTVDNNNRENIELVPLKAKAGYTAGYNDPEFISGLPTFQLPFLSADRKYRTFQIDGDSMLPIPDKSYITCEFLSNWNDVKDGHAYIILTLDEGIVFKVIYNQIRTKKKLLLRSLNHAYDPYEVPVADVKEIWKFVYYTSPQMPEPVMEKDELLGSVNKLQQEMKHLIGKVDGMLIRSLGK